MVKTISPQLESMWKEAVVDYFKVGVHKTPVTKFLNVAHNICATSVKTLLLVTLLAPRILWLVIDFFKNLCTPRDLRYYPRFGCRDYRNPSNL